MERVATDVPVRTPRPKPLLRTRVTWVILLVVSAVHASGCVLQPILAGAYLNGDYGAILVHGPVGSGLIAFTMFVLGPAALLFIVPGKGSFLPMIVVALLFLAEGLQVGMGYARQFGIHIPLGVAIVGTSVALVWYLVTWRYRLGERLRAQR